MDRFHFEGKIDGCFTATYINSVLINFLFNFNSKVCKRLLKKLHIALEKIHKNAKLTCYIALNAAIICHNDELSSSLSWLKIVHNSVFWYMKIKRMGIKEILRRTWLTSENKIKPPKSFSKQSSQVNSYSNSTHNCDK